MDPNLDLLQESLKRLRQKNEINEDEEQNCRTRMETGKMDKDTLEIFVASKYYLDRFSEKYKNLLELELTEIEGAPIAISFVVKKREVVEAPIDEKYPARAGVEYVRPSRPKGLSDNYTFDNFVIGDNSRFAHNAAMAISRQPGEKYNPCLIYGGVGLGKTHLLQAIGNYVYENHPTMKKIVYLTGEHLWLDFTSHIKNNTSQEFKNKYRNIDLLLIDDIHSLQGKTSTQEELFHTFNDLYGIKKQMVFTCDRPISELKNFSDRLRSRFAHGLKVDLQPPNFETKVAIIHKKLERMEKEFPAEVVELIAKSVSTNVRDLESAIMNIDGYAELTGKKITMELARERLKDTLSNLATHTANISIPRVQRIIAEYFSVSVSDLKGKKKTKSIVYPRQIAMYIIRQSTEFSTTEIGLEFGGRDHTTVMYAIQKIEDLKLADPTMETTIHNLIRSVKEHEGSV